MNKTVKLKGTNLFSKDRWDVIRTVVSKVNLITMKATMLAKAYYLSQDNNFPLDEDFYDLCTKVVTNTPLRFRGDVTPEKTTKQSHYDNMRTIFEQHFGSYIDLNGLSLSHVLNYVCKDLETAVLNNIQFNYIKYVNLYMYNHLEGINKTMIAQARNHILYDYDCPIVLHHWIQQHKAFLVPQKDQSFDFDLLKRPWIYFDYMIQICKHVETNFPNTKLLSPFVLRRSYIPKHIRLDTNSLVQLLMDQTEIEQFVQWYELEYNIKPNIKTKRDLGSSFNKVFGRDPIDEREDFMYQQSFWLFLCRFEHPTYSKAVCRDDYVFGNSITTDGCSVSLLLTTKQAKKVFKARKVKKKNKADEFEHEIKPNGLHLGCDPGKSDLAAFTDGAHTFKYTKGQRDTDCKREKYKRRSEAPRTKCIIEGMFQSKTSCIPGYYSTLQDPSLLQYENEVLSASNSRSCDFLEFLKYVRLKLFMEDTVSELYNTPRFRNDRFTRYTLMESSTDKMLNNLKIFVNERLDRKSNTCHDDIVEANANKINFDHVNIFYGNWGRNPNLKNQAPTPGIGLRRKIDKVFKTTTTCEHGTSKTCPRCKEKTLVNPELPPDRSVKKKHHLLCCTNCNSWWNRNWVGAYNILLKGLRAVSSPA